MSPARPARPVASKLTPLQRKVRAQRKVLRAKLRDTVKSTSLLSEPVPADDRPELEHHAMNHRVPAALRQHVLDKLAERVRFARRHWGRPFRMPRVSFDLRGTTAGTANALDWRVSLNPVLLVENPAEMADATAGHELAHLLTCSLYGGAATSHGRHWQSVMRALGLDADRTHSMDVMNAAVGQELYKYRCGCRLWPVKPQKHQKWSSGSAWGVCKSCDQRVAYTGEVRLNGSWYKDPKDPKHAGASPRPAPVRRPSPAATAPVARHLPTARTAPPATPAPLTRVVAGPPAPAASTNAPSDAMRRYAWDLARRLNMSLTPQQLGHAGVLGAFIEHAKKLMAAGIAGVPADPGSAGGLNPDEPTERQLAFAQALARRHGLSIDALTLSSRRKLSAWIDAHKS